jgi:hypothetical protein
MPMGPGSAFESSYAYAVNNPTVMVDPSGRRSVNMNGGRPSIENNLELYGVSKKTSGALNSGQLLRLYLQNVVFANDPKGRAEVSTWTTDELLVNFNNNREALNERVELKACSANSGFKIACNLSRTTPIEIARSKNVDVGVCPVFGCIGVGLHGGKPNFTGGVGVAVSTPSLTVTAHDPSEASGCVQSNNGFIYSQFLSGFAGGTWSSQQVDGPSYGDWKGGIYGGLMAPGAKFNPSAGPGASSGLSTGAGFIHQWSCGT